MPTYKCNLKPVFFEGKINFQKSTHVKKKNPTLTIMRIMITILASVSNLIYLIFIGKKDFQKKRLF